MPRLWLATTMAEDMYVVRDADLLSLGAKPAVERSGALLAGRSHILYVSWSAFDFTNDRFWSPYGVFEIIGI